LNVVARPCRRTLAGAGAAVRVALPTPHCGSAIGAGTG
jgi:hypothetical protein